MRRKLLYSFSVLRRSTVCEDCLRRLRIRLYSEFIDVCSAHKDSSVFSATANSKSRKMVWTQARRNLRGTLLATRNLACTCWLLPTSPECHRQPPAGKYPVRQCLQLLSFQAASRGACAASRRCCTVWLAKCSFRQAFNTNARAPQPSQGASSGDFMFPDGTLYSKDTHTAMPGLPGSWM